MRRVHFFEFHDQAWFPPTFRHYLTDTLQFGFNLFNVYLPVAPLLQQALESTGGRSIVDMCSGGGGPWLGLSEELRSQETGKNSPAIQICLTDKYPNFGALEGPRAASENHISLYPGSVDAMNVPPELKGFRTMFTSFHHFRPEAARAILQNAVDAREGIGIFEVPRRAVSTVGIMFVWVFLLSVCTVCIRPFRWSRLFWTYVVPIMPLVVMFDGVVSCLRTYSPEELRELVAGLTATASDYVWDVGEHSTGKATITYLIGCPRTSSREVIRYG